MKRIVLFILLKIAEISAAIIAYLAFSKFGFFIISLTERNTANPHLWYNFLYFMFGVVVLCLIIFLLIGIYFLIIKCIPFWIKSNWELTNKILKKNKDI